jgi:hypothetical protein
MFVVISEEAEAVVTMLNPSFEHFLIPLDHLVVAVCLVNDMTKTAGRGHGGLPWAALRLRRSLPVSQYQIERHTVSVWWELLHRNGPTPATTALGLGCAKTLRQGP